VAIRSGDWLYNLHAESIAFAQHAKNIDVARPLTPKAVIVSDEKLAQPEPAAKHELDKVFRRVRSQISGKRENCDVIDTRFGEHFKLFVLRREEEGRGGRIHNLQRMWLEGNQDAGDLERARARDQPLDDIAMAAVNAVERSHRYDCPFDVRR
jgi:hypothetical protein